MDRTPSDFIELNRWFNAHDELKNADETAAESYLLQQPRRRNACGWPKLFEAAGVNVILGEAGSGRTYEFKAKANSLRAEGKKTFYLSLHKLVSQTVEEQMEDDDKSIFSHWRDGKEQAFFFLDAVDESKLTRVSHFRDALDKFGSVLGPAIPRAQIFISSRIKDWLPVTDRRNIVEAFGLNSGSPEQQVVRNGDDYDLVETAEETSKKSPAASVHVWCIAGLEQDQVKAYVQGRGVSNAGDFISALSDAYAWELAVRPLDVNLLVNYWSQHQRIGHPAEMFEELTNEQLKERTEKTEYERAFPLDAGRARQGAETLAAATILCRKLDFKINDDSALLNSPTALDAQTCLPEGWMPGEMHALLSRPLFDAAIYGSTRFHHRSLAEYLAACWLRRLLDHECPVSEVIDLLFSSNRGQLVAKQSRLPVATWLACIGRSPWVELVRNNLLNSAPEAFFRHGDPSVFSTEFKNQILATVVRRFSNREMVHFETSEVALYRMGDPALASALTIHLSAPDISDALKTEFTILARVGRIQGAVSVALNLLVNSSSSSSLTISCMRLIEELGTPDQIRAMATWISSLENLSCDLCWMSLQMLFPVCLPPANLVILLTKLSDPQNAANHLIYSLRHEFSRLESILIIIETIHHLLILVETQPHVNKYPISSRYLWAARALRPLIRASLKEPSLSLENQVLVSRALWVVTQNCVKRDSENTINEDKNPNSKWDVRSITENYPEVRRQAFWLHFDQVRHQHERQEAWHSAIAAWNYALGLHDPNQQDFERFAVDVATRGDLYRRLGALHQCIRYSKSKSNRQSRSVEKRISAAIADSAELSKIYRSARSFKWKARLLAWWEREKSDGFLAKWWWEIKWQRIIKPINKFRDLKWLYLHRKKIQRGELLRDLGHLLEENGFDSKWAPNNWNKLRAKYPAWVVRSVQQGCLAIWKSHDPSEPSQGNSVSYKIIAGLGGLQYLWKSGDAQFQKWSDADAERASRYALEEMNGFSDWLPELAKHHPNAVIRVLRGRIDLEWNDPTGDGTRCLDRLRWSKTNLGAIMSPIVLEMLQAGDPESYRVLNSAVQLLVRHSQTPQADYASLAHERISNYAYNEPAFRLWFLTWLQTNTSAALDHLEALLSSGLANSEQVSSFAVDLCAGLGDRFDREMLISNPVYLHPSVAPRFIQWVHRWVPEETDIQHSSGSYTPVPRDDAQRFRGTLLSLVAEQNTPDAEAALISLIDVPELRLSRDFLLHLLDKLSRRLADGISWPTSAIRIFEIEHQAIPLTSTDLFNAACRRLQTIKTEVEQPFDLVFNAYVREGDDESQLRRFLALRLGQLSRGLYTAPQEAVIFGELRPDLRVECAGIAGSVPIEVKLADGRSLTSLSSDLEGQLVGDYLSSHQSRHGVFVVGLTSARSYWEHPTTGQRLSFIQMIDYLRARSAELLARNNSAEGLEVYGINFQPRVSVRA